MSYNKSKIFRKLCSINDKKVGLIMMFREKVMNFQTIKVFKF